MSSSHMPVSIYFMLIIIIKEVIAGNCIFMPLKIYTLYNEEEESNCPGGARQPQKGHD